MSYVLNNEFRKNTSLIAGIDPENCLYAALIHELFLDIRLRLQTRFGRLRCLSPGEDNYEGKRRQK
jgi:hypothetical protein